MTITVRYIEGIDELKARWMEIWLLMDALHQHHADLVSKELRPGREERAYEHVRSSLQRGSYWFQVAEQDGDIVAIASQSILAKGRTFAGRIGEMGNVYLKESVRGQGLSRRMYETRLETLRERGESLWESANSASNARIFEVFGSNTWGCTLRRPLRDSMPSMPLPMCNA